MFRSEAAMKLPSLFRVAVLCLATSLPSLAQDVQLNQPDNASTTQNNSTTQSETNHAVTANGVIGAWNDSSQIATLGTMFTSFVGWRGSPNGTAFSGGGFLNFTNNTQC